ncbi:MAG: pyridoxamine 5-phosphate oxidase [Planctomycetota bacterium]|jgi:pyridoxamine 5'-phosphate oxidase
MSTGHGPTPSIDFDAPPADPVAVFEQWFAEAQKLPTPNPNAMTLATIDADGAPSARIVLLRGFSREGARFFTNRNSRKGRALAANARAALLFHWDLLDRQVRIEGRVSLASDAESDEYFAQRPVDSRVNAWASDQSEPVANRAELERRAAELTARFASGDVPRPPHWGGYRVSLDKIEFWQGDKYRLHDRIVYTRQADGSYAVTRLCP